VPIVDVLKSLPRLRSGVSRRERKDDKHEWVAALFEILDGDVLKGISTDKKAKLRSEICRALIRLNCPRGDRGGPFVRSDGISSDYKKDWYCDERIGGVCNHESRPHMTSDLHRYLFTSCYAKLFGRSPDLRDYPSALLPNHKNIFDKSKRDSCNREYFDDRFRVQLAKKPSTTITSHLAKDGHYFIHYDQTQCRALTVREAARLQTFPDNYYFCGTRTQQYVQVGNAVPPLLAVQIAGVVSRALNLNHLASDIPPRARFVGVAC
jgi:DNA (cytosine-5)-methyltransferase 1